MATSRLTGWLVQLWADIRSSTDAGLLAVGRWFGLLYGPIDRHAPIDQALRKAMRNRLPEHVRWKHALGSITYLLFVVLVVTGVLLSFHYRPSVQEAYPSIQHIMSDVTFGWLFRNVHFWTASLIVIVALLHLARVFLDVVYKPPRETNWLVGMLLLLVIVAFGATGYLLPWDQWAYWTSVEILATYRQVPVLGNLAADLLTGDVEVSGATLSRHFALHVIVLPWLAFALLAFHFGLVRRHGIAPPPVPPGRPGRERTFYPHHLLRSFATASVVVAVLVSLAILWPRPMADVANPYQTPSDLEVTWLPAAIGLAVVRHVGAWGVVASIVIGVVFAALPLFDRGAERRIGRKPFVMAIGIVVFAILAWAWFQGRRIQSPAPELVTSGAAPAAPEAAPPAAPAEPAAADTAGGTGGR